MTGTIRPRTVLFQSASRIARPQPAGGLERAAMTAGMIDMKLRQGTLVRAATLFLAIETVSREKEWIARCPGILGWAPAPHALK